LNSREEGEGKERRREGQGRKVGGHDSGKKEKRVNRKSTGGR